jgi:hypothetical protein
MLGVWLFPQVLSDLNFFNVKSKKELASRLRAVQRVAVAAIGAYLIVRYAPILAAKLGGTLISKLAFPFAITVSYWCLSAPSTCLITGGGGGYLAVLAALREYDNKQFIELAISVGLFFTCYICGQVYKKGGNIPTNLFEKLFQKVEERYAQPLYHRFYSQIT